MITLSLLHPADKALIQSWTFDQETVIRLGRSADNDVILYSAVVSRYHVEVHRTSEGWELKNLGANGTYLDGKRISQVKVESGLIVRLARSGPIIQITTVEEELDPLRRLLSKAIAQGSTPTPQKPGVQEFTFPEVNRDNRRDEALLKPASDQLNTDHCDG